MKIRTITCHDVCNYGASLQAFALQNYLERKGHDVRIIDYLPDYSVPYKLWEVSPASHLYKPSKYFFLVKLFWAIRRYFQIRPTFARKEAFKSFKDRFLHLTEHYSKYSELATNPPEADLYISGSDQIWRTNLGNGKDPAFFLQFGDRNTKRASYAASFGLPYLTDGMDYLIHNYLSQFDAISVRESSGIKILESLGISGELVADPVLLLSKSEWTELLGIKSAKVTEPYILVYDLNGRCMRNEKKNFVRDYAKKHNLKIVAINDIRKTKYAQLNVNDASPIDFVNLIMHAKIVVSDSFHATAFSCIMNTPFRVFFDKPQAARIKDFLDVLGLSMCMNSKDTEINIDWGITNSKLNGYVNNSIQFINKITGE